MAAETAENQAIQGDAGGNVVRLPNRGGRPKGSKTKLPKDVRAQLDEMSPRIILQLYREAMHGHAWRKLKGGSRERVDLTPDERFQRFRLLLDKSVPTLRSQELSGPDKSPLLPPVALGSDFTTMALCMGATDAAHAAARAILKDVNGNPTGDPDRLAAAILKARTPAHEADDAAQERGEVATRSDNLRRDPEVPEQNIGKATSEMAGLSRKDIHEADAETEITDDRGEVRAIVKREGNGWSIRRADDRKPFGDFSSRADAIARATDLTSKGYI